MALFACKSPRFVCYLGRVLTVLTGLIKVFPPPHGKAVVADMEDISEEAAKEAIGDTLQSLIGSSSRADALTLAQILNELSQSSRLSIDTCRRLTPEFAQSFSACLQELRQDRRHLQNDPCLASIQAC